MDNHAKDGADFVTVHCGVTKETVSRLKEQGRVMLGALPFIGVDTAKAILALGSAGLVNRLTSK